MAGTTASLRMASMSKDPALTAESISSGKMWAVVEGAVGVAAGVGADMDAVATTWVEQYVEQVTSAVAMQSENASWTTSSTSWSLVVEEEMSGTAATMVGSTVRSPSEATTTECAGFLLANAAATASLMPSFMLSRSSFTSSFKSLRVAGSIAGSGGWW
jgi:hypothetical protein